SDSACICLCVTGLTDSGKPPWVISCDNLECRRLENIDIVDNNLIFISPSLKHPTRPNSIEYWKGGFLFGRSIKSYYNGLPEEKTERTLKMVEKRRIGDKLILSVCDQDTYYDIEGDKEILEKEGRNEAVENKKNYRLDYFGNTCIVTEFEEGKQFENLAEQVKLPNNKLLHLENKEDDLYKEAIKKYEDFMKKYESGYEVEDAMYSIGLIYKEKLSMPNRQGATATKIFKEFLEKFPDSELAGLVEVTMNKDYTEAVW
ncbi:MAG: tol-pal system YbgF family protein, partial [Candidatus Thorarchaeota archaeon]